MNEGLSVAIVIHNEAHVLRRVLDSLVPSTRPGFLWEIILLDNNSTDSYKEILASFQQENPTLSLRYIRNSENNLGQARKVAVEQASYSVVAFTDADCVVPKNWICIGYEQVKNLSQSDPTILGIGGGNRVPNTGEEFYSALRIMLDSTLGSFGTIQGKPKNEARYLEHIPTCNIFYLREKLLKIGNFSPNFPFVCEDLELSRRAQLKGMRFYYLPSMELWHYHCPTKIAWLKKMFRYGRGQIAVAQLYPRHLSGIKGAPLLLAISSIIAVILFPFYYALLFAFYLLVIFVYSLFLSLRAQQLKSLFSLFILFLITHIFYALGEFWGICQLGKVENRKMK